MAAVGGPLREVSIRGRSFPVAGDGDSGRVLGGDQVEVEPNGDGSARIVVQVVPWQYDGVSLVLDDARGDQEFLMETVAMGREGKFVPISATEASNITYRGDGQVVGEIKRAGGNATAPITLKGPGSLSR